MVATLAQLGFSFHLSVRQTVRASFSDASESTTRKEPGQQKRCWIRQNVRGSPLLGCRQEGKWTLAFCGSKQTKPFFSATCKITGKTLA